MSKYQIAEVEGFQGSGGPDDIVRVFSVEWDNGSPYRARAHVWVDPKYDSVRCTGCSTPLVAMSAGCPHVRAVRRVLKREN